MTLQQVVERVKELRSREELVQQDIASLERFVETETEKLELLTKQYTEAVVLRDRERVAELVEQIAAVERSLENHKKELEVLKNGGSPITDEERAELLNLYREATEAFKNGEFAEAVAEAIKAKEEYLAKIKYVEKVLGEYGAVCNAMYLIFQREWGRWQQRIAIPSEVYINKRHRDGYGYY
jgi:ABC-type taurine transport system substrate-binding protein